MASGNWAHQASVRRPKQRWVACGPPHCSPVRSPMRRTAAAAGVPAAQLRLCQLHLRRRRLRLLHPSCHRHRRLHLHRRHRSPHLCHHLHPHPLLRLHRHYRRPHHPLQLPCPACPC
ncbi:unnamed protein product [Closterium sp. NIES-53]